VPHTGAVSAPALPTAVNVTLLPTSTRSLPVTVILVTLGIAGADGPPPHAAASARQMSQDLFMMPLLRGHQGHSRHQRGRVHLAQDRFPESCRTLNRTTKDAGVMSCVSGFELAFGV